MYLKDFHVVRPKFEQSQESWLEWIVNAHVHTKKQACGWNEEDPQCLEFREKLRETLFRLGAGENKIQKRSVHIEDGNHLDWEKMQIYNINSAPEGYDLTKRMEIFNQASFEIFEKMYPEEAPLPPHLIHVTCTGYVAPSPAQKLVSQRSSGSSTMVTHAYHMGCYGALSAIRLAMGHSAAFSEESDIVHTEFSSLHLNPSVHTTEQLVVQSLFADGFIKYSLGNQHDSPSFKILAIQEEIIENSTSKMTWTCHNWGFQMSISKDIPILLRKSLEGYLKRLAKKANRDLKLAKYAIHPGGPKIIEQIAAFLQLEPEQIKHSKEIMQNCGNMSSGTLPHIWEKMLQDPSVESGTLVVGLAFGPGLSICGNLLEVRR